MQKCFCTIFTRLRGGTTCFGSQALRTLSEVHDRFPCQQYWQGASGLHRHDWLRGYWGQNRRGHVEHGVRRVGKFLVPVCACIPESDQKRVLLVTLSRAQRRTGWPFLPSILSGDPQTKMLTASKRPHHASTECGNAIEFFNLHYIEVRRAAEIRQ